MPTVRFRRRLLATLLVVVGGVCLPGSALAQRYPIERYTVADGLPSPRVRSVAQDATGFLWFATAGGLARHDGDRIELVLSTGARAGGIVALRPLAAGGLQAATRDGIVGEWRAGVFTPVLDLTERRSMILGLSAGADGSTWIATDLGAVRMAPDRSSRSFEGDSPGCCRFVHRDRGGRVWAGSDAGLLVLEGGGFESVDVGLPDNVAVNLLLEDAAGTLWAGTDRGLYRESAGRFRPFETPLGARPVVLSGAVDRRGRIWIGTERGAFRFSGEIDRVLTSRNGLPDDRVNDITIDHEGTVWFGTDGGAAKMVESSFATYTTAHGLAADYVVDVEEAVGGQIWVAGRSGVSRLVGDGFEPAFESGSATVTSVAPLGSGGILVGTDRGLIAIEGGSSRPVASSDEFAGARITALLARPDATWIGTDGGLFGGDAGGAEPVLVAELAGAHVTTLAADRLGRLWVGTLESGLFVGNEEGFEPVLANEFPAATIRDLAVAGRDLVWVATEGEGVLAVRGEREFELSRELDGLATDYVPQLVVDHSGDLWAYTDQGLYRWEASVGPTAFRLEDGLVDLAGTPAAGAVGSDGRLWFGTPSGLTVYVPGFERPVESSPRVVLRDVRVDNVRVEVGDGLTLDHDARELTIAYTALSFRREQDTRFQYRLIGQSEGWSPITRQRRVTFGELRPGSYEFQVRAITARGQWSAEPAILTVRVEPAVWEALWFRTLAAALLVAFVALMFHSRLRKVEDERQRLRLMVDRRTRELVEKNSLLERMATTDELTGLPNRRFFLDNLERELRKLSRTPTPQPLSVLVLDIDRFKPINDQHGHAAGDEVLRRLGRRLAQSVRATDLPARYGGEEFAILLPATDPEGARFLAEKLRAEVEEMDVRYEGRRIPVTISLGIATVAGAVRYDRELEEDLLRRADEAMYRAKEGGRNRVVVDGDPADAPEV